MDRTDPFHGSIIECLPHLRAFARMLARNPSAADDLVQDTVLRAISHKEQFQVGTNLRAWLMTILRNSFFNDNRRMALRAARAREVAHLEPVQSGGQEERLALRDLKREFEKLPATQREALVLVGANGFSYEEAAQIAGCAVGTMKSRVSRARLHLQVVLGEGAGDLKAADDGAEEAVVTLPARVAASSRRRR